MKIKQLEILRKIKRHKYHPLVHKLHRKHNISKKTLFYVKEYGPHTNVPKTIIKEIEYRFKSPRIKAVDFDGIITIDEIELHLHPEWQGKIANILSELFPNVQFFATTHSPHIIQASKPNQIIALEVKGNKVVQRHLPETKYGFQGWTVEEVLTDVMGMSDTRTTLFNNLLNEFGKHIDNGNYSKANEVFNQIDIILHPQNHLRKLLKFQLAEIKG